MLPRLRGLAQLDLVRAIASFQGCTGAPNLLAARAAESQPSSSALLHHAQSHNLAAPHFHLPSGRLYTSSPAASLAVDSTAAQHAAAGHVEPGPEPEPETSTSASPLDKEALLSAALEHVHAHGWSNEALVAAARDHGLSPAVTGVLGAGEADLVNFFVKRCNGQLQELLEARHADLAAMGTTQIVKFCIRARLEMIQPYISSWPQALSIVAQPAHLPAYLHLMLELVETIWQAAGDRSVDSSWYTKRLLLSGVYAATELYMLSDFSPAYADTWEALDRRLADVAAAGKASRNLGAFVASMGKTATAGLASLMEVADKK